MTEKESDESVIGSFMKWHEEQRPAAAAWPTLKSEAIAGKRIMLSKGALSKESMVPSTERLGAEHKPYGLWWAIGDAWIEWVRVEMPGWMAEYTHVYEVELHGPMLRIDTREGLLAFHERFHTRPSAEVPAVLSRMCIDWHLVAKEYSGIEIAPYQPRERFNFGMIWYYSWDVASGCAWMPEAALARWTLLENR